MNRPPYLLARSSALKDERYFHAANLATRLSALAADGEIDLRYATVARSRAPSGACVKVYVIEPGGDRCLIGYVFREGLPSPQVRDRLEVALANLEQTLDRRAA